MIFADTDLLDSGREVVDDSFDGPGIEKSFFNAV